MYRIYYNQSFENLRLRQYWKLLLTTLFVVLGLFLPKGENMLRPCPLNSPSKIRPVLKHPFENFQWTPVTLEGSPLRLEFGLILKRVSSNAKEIVTLVFVPRGGYLTHVLV